MNTCRDNIHRERERYRRRYSENLCFLWLFLLLPLRQVLQTSSTNCTFRWNWMKILQTLLRLMYSIITPGDPVEVYVWIREVGFGHPTQSDLALGCSIHCFWIVRVEEFLLFTTTCIACAWARGKRSAYSHADMRTVTVHGYPLRRMEAMRWRITEIHADVRKYNYSRSPVKPFHTYIGLAYLVWTPRPSCVSPLLS